MFAYIGLTHGSTPINVNGHNCVLIKPILCTLFMYNNHWWFQLVFNSRIYHYWYHFKCMWCFKTNVHQKSTCLVSGTLIQKELLMAQSLLSTGCQSKKMGLEAEEKDVKTPSVLPWCVCPGPMGTSESRQYSLEGQKGVAFGCSYEGLMAQQRERADPSIDGNENKDWSHVALFCLVGDKDAGGWGWG